MVKFDVCSGICLFRKSDRRVSFRPLTDYTTNDLYFLANEPLPVTGEKENQSEMYQLEQHLIS